MVKKKKLFAFLFSFLTLPGAPEKNNHFFFKCSHKRGHDSVWLKGKVCSQLRETNMEHAFCSHSHTKVLVLGKKKKGNTFWKQSQLKKEPTDCFSIFIVLSKKGGLKLIK